jgi:hypothetical protein
MGANDRESPARDQARAETADEQQENDREHDGECQLHELRAAREAALAVRDDEVGGTSPRRELGRRERALDRVGSG